MRFDPIKKEIFTDKGELIKKMNCPYKMEWDKLDATTSLNRKCSICDHLIIDTEFLSDEEVLNLVKETPATCLKVDLNQNNVKIISNGILGQK